MTATAAETSPKRGRPSLRGRHKATLRITAEDLHRLRKSADANHRSLSEELELRVRESFQTDRREEMIHVMRETRQIVLEDLRRATETNAELYREQDKLRQERETLTRTLALFAEERAAHEQQVAQLVETNERLFAELRRKLFDFVEIAVVTAVTNVLEGKVLKEESK